MNGDFPGLNGAPLGDPVSLSLADRAPLRAGRLRSCEKIPEGSQLVAGGGAFLATPPVNEAGCGPRQGSQRLSPCRRTKNQRSFRWFRKLRSTTGYKLRSLPGSSSQPFLSPRHVDSGFTSFPCFSSALPVIQKVPQTRPQTPSPNVRGRPKTPDAIIKVISLADPRGLSTSVKRKIAGMVLSPVYPYKYVFGP